MTRALFALALIAVVVAFVWPFTDGGEREVQIVGGPVGLAPGRQSRGLINPSVPPPPFQQIPVDADEGLVSQVEKGWAAEAARVEAEELERQAEEARRNSQFAPSQPRISSSPQTLPAECYGRVIPPAQLWNESRCSYDPGLPSPPSFCGGRGCIGPYQIDNGHFAADSPWNDNPAVSGTCYGLDSSTLAGQEECARRLGPGAWG